MNCPHCNKEITSPTTLSVSEDTRRLDWLQAHPLPTEVAGGFSDGEKGTAWAIAGHESLSLRDCIDAAMQSTKASGG